MKEKNGDSFLTCIDACATIHTMFGMPIEIALTNYQELSAAFDDVLDTKIDDIPENMLKDYVNLRANIVAFMRLIERKRNANSYGGSWA